MDKVLAETTEQNRERGQQKGRGQTRETRTGERPIPKSSQGIIEEISVLAHRQASR